MKKRAKGDRTLNIFWIVKMVSTKKNCARVETQLTRDNGRFAFSCYC